MCTRRDTWRRARQWANGRKEGKGTLHLKDGDMFHGVWADGRISGDTPPAPPAPFCPPACSAARPQRQTFNPPQARARSSSARSLCGTRPTCRRVRAHAPSASTTPETRFSLSLPCSPFSPPHPSTPPNMSCHRPPPRHTRPAPDATVVRSSAPRPHTHRREYPATSTTPSAGCRGIATYVRLTFDRPRTPRDHG